MACFVKTAVQEQKSLCPKAHFALVRHWEGLSHPSHLPSLKMQLLLLVPLSGKVAAEVAWADQAAAGCPAQSAYGHWAGCCHRCKEVFCR